MSSSNDDKKDDAPDAGDKELPYMTWDAKKPVRLRMGKEGQAAIEARTVMQSFNETVKKFGDKPALHQKVPCKNMSPSDAPWKSWTWKEYWHEVNNFAKSLMFLELERYDMINIIGFNAPEWYFSNYGAIAAGLIPAGIYSTNNPEACHYISNHSEAKVVVCHGLEQLQKYYSISSMLPKLKAIVVYGLTEALPSDASSKVPSSVKLYTYDEFVQLGRGDDKNDASLDEKVRQRSESWKPNETCTLIYTSGTTGPPKAVMITNDNITWTARTMVVHSKKQYITTDDVLISYLPLSHIAAQILDMHMPMHTGCQVYFALPDALKGSLGVTLKDVRPTIFFAVPRVWEKFYEKLQEVGKSTTGMKKTLSAWAKDEALSYWESREHDAMKDFYFSRDLMPFGYYLAKVILHQVHAALGFDRCEEFYTAAAPIDVKILKYFASIDIPIMENFGQSECTGPHSTNCIQAFKFGSVGRPFTGTESKIDETTGEFCYRGRHIFAGYMGMRDKTKETIDEDGWLHSGDVMKIDEDHDERVTKPSGFITITGRIKELIVTAGGENVPPVLIEEQVKLAMPAISNVMVIGDKRKFLTALLCLRAETDDAEGVPTNKLAGAALDACKEIGSGAKTTDEASKDDKWTKYIQAGIDRANEKATSRAQKIGKWTMLVTDFSEKGGELTPTMKLKRSSVQEKYADVIEKMYA